MKLISWNCQGLGSTLTIQALRALVVKEKSDLLFLMETKNGEAMLSRLQGRLHFLNLRVHNPVGSAGGLAIF